MEVKTPKVSMDAVIDALTKQLILINVNEIVLVYVEKFRYSNIIRVVLKNGTVISLDAENLQIYNIETPSDVLHRVAVMMLDRDE